MTVERQTKTVYKRVERDGEFRERLRVVGLWVDGYEGVGLDNHAWAERRMQRRIVDDFA